MILNNICEKCDGKGHKVGPGYIYENCSNCGGKGTYKKLEEGNMHKILAKKNTVVNFEQKKTSEVSDSPVSDMQKKISEMSTSELRAASKRHKDASKK